MFNSPSPQEIPNPLLKVELNIPGGLFKWLQEGPPESPFLGAKNGFFPDFPLRGSVGGRRARKTSVWEEEIRHLIWIPDH